MSDYATINPATQSLFLRELQNTGLVPRRNASDGGSKSGGGSDVKTGSGSEDEKTTGEEEEDEEDGESGWDIASDLSNRFLDAFSVGRSSEESEDDGSGSPGSTPSSDNTLLYVGLGIGGLVLVGGGLYFLLRK